jgi:hypothetical protein
VVRREVVTSVGRHIDSGVYEQCMYVGRGIGVCL